MNELTYFEIVTVWAEMTERLELVKSIAEGVGNYEGRVSEVQAIVDKLTKAKAERWDALYNGINLI